MSRCGFITKSLSGRVEKVWSLHPAMSKHSPNLYGYTNDADPGYRHALLDESSLTKDDALFMLVACSALCWVPYAEKAKRFLTLPNLLGN